jgi:quercetin dioxygenase-like cupin family protein
MSRASIEHTDDLPAYAPPGHSETRNVRLVDADFCGRFEMILGEIAPGGAADRHSHAVEHQVIYVLDGTARVRLGDGPAQACGPGAVIRIPPEVEHEVTVAGDTPLKLIVVYSPPLPPRDDRPVET